MLQSNRPCPLWVEEKAAGLGEGGGVLANGGCSFPHPSIVICVVTTLKNMKSDITQDYCLVLIVKVTIKMQLYRLIYYYQSALHVSGDVFAHHQEHLTVFTSSGSIHQKS